MLQDSLPAFHLEYFFPPHADTTSITPRTTWLSTPPPPVNVSNKLGNAVWFAPWARWRDGGELEGDVGALSELQLWHGCPAASTWKGAVKKMLRLAEQRTFRSRGKVNFRRRFVWFISCQKQNTCFDTTDMDLDNSFTWWKVSIRSAFSHQLIS